MATPSSSATTPSPRPSYLEATATVVPSSVNARESNLSLKEERQRAIQKFFANAELSQLARGLRTRLSYAGFKATHNLSHNTLNDLEARAQSQQSGGRQTPTRPGSNHYGNSATQNNNTMAPASSSRALARKGTMPPPPVTASATQSLFTSLLQPPPNKRARTIHNPEDPPVPPPTKPKTSTPSRKGAKAPRATAASTTKPRARKDVKGKRRETEHGAGPSSRMITPQSTLGSEGFADNDDDMKAAATLTSLLRSRPSMSMSAGASSPRSSLSAGSDAGSSHSFSHYAQSSTRTTAPTSLAPSQESSFPHPYTRQATPPASSNSRHSRTQSLPHVGSTTPKGQMRQPTSRLANSSTPHPPSDTEAADLMLFLATSPSPVRATTSKDRDAKDMAAFRTLSGNPGIKGRVLFPAANGEERAPPASGAKPLRRDGSASQEHLMGAPPIPSSPLNPNSLKRPNNQSQGASVASHPRSHLPSSSIPIQPMPVDVLPAHMLAAPPSPTPARAHTMLERSASAPTPLDKAGSSSAAPPTPGHLPFNLHDFINDSPLPAPSNQPPPAKLTSLRANVGRKLFEEHQGGPSASPSSGPSSSRESMSAHGGGLGAGIDLMTSSA